MKKIVPIVSIMSVIVILLVISSCYWQPEESTGGSITLNLIAKDLPQEFNGYAFYVDFWNADDIDGELSGNTVFVTIQADAEPLFINGTDYFEEIGNPDGSIPDGGDSGGITFEDIPEGILYKIRLRLAEYDGGEFQNFWTDGMLRNIGGLSEAFEVTPGGNVNVPIDIYYLS
jgi:hypothetical protein